MKPLAQELGIEIIQVEENPKAVLRYGLRGGFPVFIKEAQDGTYLDRKLGTMPPKAFAAWATT